MREMTKKQETPTTTEALKALEVIKQSCKVLEAYGASYVVSIQLKNEEVFESLETSSVNRTHSLLFLEDMQRAPWSE